MHNEGFLSVEYIPLKPTLLNGKNNTRANKLPRGKTANEAPTKYAVTKTVPEPRIC